MNGRRLIHRAPSRQTGYGQLSNSISQWVRVNSQVGNFRKRLDDCSSGLITKRVWLTRWAVEFIIGTEADSCFGHCIPRVSTIRRGTQRHRRNYYTLSLLNCVFICILKGRNVVILRTFDVWSAVYPVAFAFVCQDVIDGRTDFVGIIFVFVGAWQVIGRSWLECLVDVAPRFVGREFTRHFGGWPSVDFLCVAGLEEGAQRLCRVRDSVGSCSGRISSQRQDLLGRQELVFPLHWTQPLVPAQTGVEFLLVQLR